MNIVISVEDESWSKQATPSIEAKSMLYYLQSAGNFYCKTDYITDRQNYETYLLAYTLDGVGYLKYRGQEHVLKKNDCFFIYCGEPHIYWTDPKKKWRFVWTHFNGSNIRGYFHKIYSNSGAVYSFNEDNIILQDMYSILELLSENSVNMQFAASKLIVEILTELVIINNGSDPNKVDKNLYVEKTIKYIEDKSANSISLADIANVANISKYHFSRLFKTATGYSPCEYLIKTRINNSKQLLKFTNKSIGDISYEVGFQSISHFVKTFKESEDITPGVFRNYWR